MELQDAVRNAIAFAKQTLGAERTLDVRLEEVESSSEDDRSVWLITLSSAPALSSALNDARPFAAMRAAFGADVVREYKIFAVAKDTGEILSMKIRMLAAPTM